MTSNHQNEEASGESGPPGDAEAKRKPETLEELYRIRKADPKDLLTALARREKWTVDEHDMGVALALLPEHDPELRTTFNFALQAMTEHGGRFGPNFVPFFAQSVADDLGPPGRWLPDGQDGDASAEAFSRLLKEQGATLRAEPPRRLFRAVLIAALILVSQRALDPETGLMRLREAIGPPKEAETHRANRAIRFRAVVDHPMTIQKVRVRLAQLGPWMDRAAKAEAKAQSLEARAKLARTRADDLETLLAASEAEKERLELQIAGLKAEIEQLGAERHGSSLARVQEVSQLRGQVEGFLDNEVLDLLRSAREGLGLDPPRVRFVDERLEDLDLAVRRRLAWLKSSD